MAKRVHPAPAEDASATTASTKGSMPPLGPLNRLYPLKRPFAYKENTEIRQDHDENNNKSSSSWTDAATQLAAGACCTTGGLSEYVFDCNDDTVEDTLVAATNPPLWMDYLWLCEGDGKGIRNSRRSRRARLFLQQQPSLKSLSGKASFDQSSGVATVNAELLELDYARRHEDFFEALLKEQGEKCFPSSSHTASSSSSSNTERDRVLKKSDSRDTCSSVSSGVSATSNLTAGTRTVASSIMNASLPSESSVKTLRKKHSPLKLHKPKSSKSREKSQNHSHHHHTRVAPIEAYSQMYNPSLTTHEAICLDTIMAKNDLLNPADYVHANCILQKDKGRGERLKTCISAQGREPCLDKLRDKMKLVLQVSSSAGSSSGTAKEGQRSSRKSTATTGMKRRMAKIAAIGPTYIETRSMLELQLGFLTMQYGLLIHWDTVKTGKILFICLRKMCHDSFYSKVPDLLPEPTLVLNQQQKRTSSRILAKPKREATPPLVIRNHQGNHAIYQRSSGSTEVVLVDGAYRVPQPEVFAPSVLTVDIHDVTGLDYKRSQWTLSVTFDGHTEIAHLEYNPDTNAFKTTRTTPCKWEMATPQTTSFDMAGLEIRLFEQRTGLRSVGNILANNNRRTSSNNNYSVSNRLHSRKSSNGSLESFGSNVSSSGIKGSKKMTSRLASTMTMPMDGLVSQPSASRTSTWKLTIPFTHDQSAKLTLSLSHQSDYSHWLYKELRARRSEEIANSSSSWQPSLLKLLVSPSVDGSLIGVEDDHIMDYHYDHEDNCDCEDEYYLSDWLCGFCYVFSLSAPQ